MPSQTALTIVVCMALLVLIAARIALNGQISRARARAREQAQRWREQQEAQRGPADHDS